MMTMAAAVVTDASTSEFPCDNRYMNREIPFTTYRGVTYVESDFSEEAIEGLWTSSNIPIIQPEYDHLYTIADSTGHLRHSCTLIADDQQENIPQKTEERQITPREISKLSRSSIDGYFKDWDHDKDVVFVGTDIIENRPKGITIFDIDTVSYVFHDNTLFIQTTITGEAEQLDSRVSYYINTDNNMRTGFDRHYGYDILVQGNGKLFSLADSNDLVLTYIGNVPIALSPGNHKVIELAIPGELIGGFAKQFQLYLRFGSQPKDLTGYDEFGPFTLSQKNRLIPQEPKIFPIWIIYAVAGFFAGLLILFHLGILPNLQIPHSQKRSDYPTESGEEDHNQY